MTFPELRRTFSDELCLDERKFLIVNWGGTKLDGDTIYRILKEEDKFIAPRPVTGYSFEVFDLC